MGMKKKKGSTSFIQSFFPTKSDSKKQFFYKLISLGALCVFFVCAVMLLNEFIIQPSLSNNEEQVIKNIYYSSDDETRPTIGRGTPSTSPAERDTQGRLIRFINLQKVNSDITGWIKIPNTDIDLPVLQANEKEPEFYLKHDYNKKHATYGSIFADYRTPIAGDMWKSAILYGHSLNSGRMFTQLNKYKKLDFYKTAPVFTFDTIDDPSQWKIISVFLTNTLPEQGQPFNYLKTTFKNDSDYLNFVYQLRIRSIYNTGVSFNAGDKIVLLSTCSYEFKDFREVIVARKVRAGEDDSVQTEPAVYNQKVLYPDCWYQKHGGTKPVWPKTYEQAVKMRLLSWSEE